MMFKAKPARKIVRPVLSSSKRCGLSIMGPAQLGRFWKPGGGQAGRHRHRWRHQSLDGANCTGCGDVTRVTPLTLYREWIVQAARQRGWGGPPFAFARNHVRQSSLEHLGLRGEGSTPVPLPPPDIIENIGFLSNLVDKPPGTPHNTGRRERAGDLFPGCRGHSRPTAHAHSEAMMRAVRTPMSLHRNVQSTRHTPIARKNSLTVAAVARAART
jgi:hypothetical protein